MSNLPFVAAMLWLSLAQNAGPPSAQQDRVLLLTDGRVLVGRIEPVTDGFVLIRRYGRITIPAEKVEKVLPDLQAAYRYRRRQVNGGEASEYVRLAYWCLKYKLFDEAEECVREALQIEPGNAAIQRLARQVQRLRELSRKQKTATTTVRTVSAEGQLPGGKPIPAEARRLFALRIQPMITRRCSAASCHGPSTKNTFPLWPSTIAAPAVTTYNIRQLMQFIDYQRPDESPLLQKATIAHGGARKAPLQLPRQAKAIGWLRRWIEVVARDATPSSVSDPTTGPLEPPADSPEAAPEKPPATTRPEAPRELPPALRPGSQPSGKPASTTPDPFDPDAFNRRFLGPEEQASEGRR